MSAGPLDLQIQRYLEGSLSSYEEDVLLRALHCGGALADRFVEWRELERGLAELYGGRKPAPVPVGAPRPEACRLRRFPHAEPEPRQGWPSEIADAYVRRFAAVDLSSHRRALAHCLGLITDELQDLLRGRYALGMTCRALAEHLARPTAEIEENLNRIQRFLAGCVRIRLERVRERHSESA